MNKTYEEYREALLSVGPAERERIYAEADKYLGCWDMVRLVQSVELAMI